jgi:putative membrane protein
MYEDGRMGRLILRLLINSLALWLTTLIIPAITIVPFAPGETLEYVITLLLTALIFGLVNGIIGGIVRVVAFPLYVITLGLISLVVNGLLFLLVAWISSNLGFGLFVSPDNTFWWGVLGALVLGVISWLIGIILRPFTKNQKRSGR